MARFETNVDKIRMSYELTKNHKFFRKARAFVFKDNKLLLIRIDYKDGRVHYLLPGGGVDDGETIKEAIIRETLEEYNAEVDIIKYLDKQFYNIDLEYNGESFRSNRVEYYYICNFKTFANNMSFGIGNEFVNPEKTYSKVELSLNEVLKLRPKDINSISLRTYEKLVNYMKNNG